MKRVLLLGFGKISHMPYMQLYLDSFEEARIDLVYWDRDGETDAEIPARIASAFRFSSRMDSRLSAGVKIKQFAAYRKFAGKVLKDNQYDLIISMQAMPGLTLLDKLITDYKKRYILDFRDLSYEHIIIYRKLIGVLAHNAKMVFTSSNAFRDYLPKDISIYTVHNYLEDSLKHSRRSTPRNRQPLRVSYWGIVRGIDINKKLVSAIGNDGRFELHYYGRLGNDGKTIQEYSKENGFVNVFFHGAYLPGERYGFVANTDILHNAFDLDRAMKNAVSNKYYDGAIFGIPQICTKGSHMGRLVTQEGIGIAIEPDHENFVDMLWSYYHSVDWDKFASDCDRVIQQACAEQAVVKRLLKDCESDQ